MSILDHAIISERYFFQRNDPLPNPFVVNSGNVQLSCFFRNNGLGKLVIYFHGNGEVAADYGDEYADWFASMDADLLVAEYRGYGASTGTPQLAAMLEDVVSIVEASDRPVDEIVVFGRSVGSIYAIEAVKRFPNLAGLILESGISDVGERLLLRTSYEELGTTRQAFESEIADRFDHAAKLSSYNGPVLVLHAANDHLVESIHADRNAAATGNPDLTKKVIFDYGDHNSIFHANLEAYKNEVAQFLK